MLHLDQRFLHLQHRAMATFLETLWWATLRTRHKSFNRDLVKSEHMARAQVCTSVMPRVSSSFHPIRAPLPRIKHRSSTNLAEVAASSMVATSTIDKWSKASKISNKFRSKFNSCKNNKWDRLEEAQRLGFRELQATLLPITHIWAQGRLLYLLVKDLLNNSNMMTSRRSCSLNTRKCKRRAVNQAKW